MLEFHIHCGHAVKSCLGATCHGWQVQYAFVRGLSDLHRHVMYMGQFLIRVCVCVCMYLCERDRETEKLQKKIRERSAADRPPGCPVYPGEHQTAIPFPAVENQCRSRKEITFIWDWGCRIFSHHFLLYKGNKEVMSHCCIPCVIVQEWQTCSHFICVVSSVGRVWQQDVAGEILIIARISQVKDKANIEMEVREDGWLHKKKQDTS